MLQSKTIMRVSNMRRHEKTEKKENMTSDTRAAYMQQSPTKPF
jgi:hypothetical protein